MQQEKTKVVVLSQGPVILEGSFEITNIDGRVEEKEGKVALCRCGFSKNKPYCDGAHKACPSTGLLM
jgi:CDGSH-type Zn-finger protein